MLLCFRLVDRLRLPYVDVEAFYESADPRVLNLWSAYYALTADEHMAEEMMGDATAGLQSAKGL